MTEIQSKFTATQALKQLQNVSKKRLYDMMNEGSISFNTETYGNNKERRVIDASELYRVFGDSFKPKNNLSSDTVSETSLNTKRILNEKQETVLKNSILNQKIQFLEEQLTREREERKRERDNGKERESQIVELNKDLLKKIDKFTEERTLLIEDRQKKEDKLKAEIEKAKIMAAQPRKKIFGIF